MATARCECQRSRSGSCRGVKTPMTWAKAGQASMRIVYVFERTDQLWGGVKVALNDANWLAARGHEVTVVSRSGPPSWMQVRCAFVQQATLDAATMPDADVYVGTFWTTVPAAAEAAQQRGAACVHYCQGYEGDNPKFAAHKDRIEAVYRLPGVRHITIAPHLTQLLRERFASNPDEVVYVIDHETFRPHLPRLRDPGAPLRVGLVGPYEVPWKDLRTGIDACRLAAAAGQPIQLVRVTNTQPHRDGQALPFPVEWHTRVKPAEMGEIYRSMDLFLGTSSGAEEGFFLPAVEAMACGVPCVLTDIPCFRSHGDGNYALFVPARDPAAMAEALVLAGRMPEIAAALREGGIAAAQRYTQHAHGIAIEAALQRAAGPKVSSTKMPSHAASQSNASVADAALALRAQLEGAAEDAEQSGDTMAAGHFLASAHCLFPDDAALAMRAAEAFRSAQDFHSALRCLRACIEQGGATVELHAMCADLHSSLGDARNAAASLALALQSGPASPDLHNRLGVSLYGLGDRDGARAHFSNALRLDPHNEDAKGNLDALANA